MIERLLEQFVIEAQEMLEQIGQLLVKLENSPDDERQMVELFRLVHTLKGNSGLFEVPDLTSVLHVAEDLMDNVRSGQQRFDQQVGDTLFKAVDFVSTRINSISEEGLNSQPDSARAAELAIELRQLVAGSSPEESESSGPEPQGPVNCDWLVLLKNNQDVVNAWPDALPAGEALRLIRYQPEPDCFFKGEDPFFLIRQLNDVYWSQIALLESAASLQEFDPFHAAASFTVLTGMPQEAIAEHFRYVPDQYSSIEVAASDFTGSGEAEPTLAPGGDQREQLSTLWQAQSTVLAMDDHPAECLTGILRSVSKTLAAVSSLMDGQWDSGALALATEQAIEAKSAEPLRAWMSSQRVVPAAPASEPAASSPSLSVSDLKADLKAPDDVKLESKTLPKTVRVDQFRIDALMSLIGEMVVAKNGLPYLIRQINEGLEPDLIGRELKTQHAVINRITDDMQDAIMQIRMMPMSFIFQRFPRLVRDLARKVGKTVELTVEGESAEADKSVIEMLADPLVHVIRNSLDHGLESAEERVKAGKAPAGKLSIRAVQQADKVLIEVVDDGRGINPEVIKKKAYERGILDERALETITDAAAVDLIFAAGLSTAASVSDISGRGVGMDAVRNAVALVNGTVSVASTLGKGTKITLSLPLSMAVSQVMMIESAGQAFGIPMEDVVETVRRPLTSLHVIKDRRTLILRDTLIPLLNLNALLEIQAEPRLNEDGEVAVLIVHQNGQTAGIVIDDFFSTEDVILKPMAGLMSAVPGYSGTALLGNGSVLLVINLRELMS